MLQQHGLMVVRETGTATVVGFSGEFIVDDACVEQYNRELKLLLQQTKAESLTVDLRGVKAVCSAFFGLLFSIHRDGTQIRLANPTHNVRELLTITQLDRVFNVTTQPV